MILEIKDYEGGKEKWHIMDNIESVIDCPTIHVPSKEYEFGESTTTTFIIVPANHIAREANEDLKLGLLVCKRTNSDSRFKIFFNTEAYICNDDAKTIKRIVIYPRERLT